MKQIIIIILGLVCSFASLAQEQVEHIIPMDQINVIVLTSNGETYFEASNSNDLQIESKKHTKGKVIGYKFPAESITFDVDYRMSSDTLYLMTPRKNSPKIIGITTYSEAIENRISLPKDKKLLIVKAEKLHFEGISNDVVIQAAQQTTFNNLVKSEIAELKCTATQSLRLNDEKKAKEFELYSNGNQILAINATRIQLYIE
ncbi:MAG: hypothetical protein AAF806_31105 [Bacteroidota bacterium]